MEQNTSPQTAQQPPEEPPIGWMLRRSLWILPAVLGFGYCSFLSYFWLARKWQRRSMNNIGLALTVICVLYLPVAFILTSAILTPLAHFLMWVGPVVLGLYINPVYLRMTWQQETLGETATMESGWLLNALRIIGGEVSIGKLTQAVRPAGVAPAGGSVPSRNSAAQAGGPVPRWNSAAPPATQEAQPSTASRPRFRSWDEIDTQRAFGTVGLLDIKAASVDQLEQLPFISRSRAEQLVALRDRGRVRDITDVIAALDLQPHEAAAIRARLAFTQTPQTGAPPAGAQPVGSPPAGAGPAASQQTASPHSAPPHATAEQQQEPATNNKPPRQGRILDV